MTRVSTVGELTTSVAHELNQPLGAILSNAEAAEMFLAADPPALDEVRDILAAYRAKTISARQSSGEWRNLLRSMTWRQIDRDQRSGGGGFKAAEHRRLRSQSGHQFREDDGSPPRLVRPGAFAGSVEFGLKWHGGNGWSTRRKAPSCCSHRTCQQRDGENRRRRLGPGIPVDSLPKLFEHFFTTKKDGMGMTVDRAHDRKRITVKSGRRTIRKSGRRSTSRWQARVMMGTSDRGTRRVSGVEGE